MCGLLFRLFLYLMAAGALVCFVYAALRTAMLFWMLEKGGWFSTGFLLVMLAAVVWFAAEVLIFVRLLSDLQATGGMGRMKTSDHISMERTTFNIVLVLMGLWYLYRWVVESGVLNSLFA